MNERKRATGPEVTPDPWWFGPLLLAGVAAIAALDWVAVDVWLMN